MPSNTLAFALIFVVVNLHVLRNLSTELYLGTYIVVAAASLVAFIASGQSTKGRHGLFFGWCAMGAIGFGVTCFTIGPAVAAHGLSRFLFAAPIYLALCLYVRTLDDLKRSLVVMVGYFTFASLTLPLQLITGPISWFAVEGERAGLYRFASLVGSLTSLGVVVGSYVALSHVMAARYRYPLLAGMGVASLASLAKAAVANVALGIAALLWMDRKRPARLLVQMITLALVGGLVTTALPAIAARLQATLVTFGFSAKAGTAANYDYMATQSAWARLTDLPLANFAALADFGTPLVYLVGGGFGMGATALVPLGAVTAPMAHNQYAELLSVFGMIGGSLMISILVLTWRRMVHLRRTPFRGVYYAYLILLLNSFFANGTVYQPAAASIIFLAMFVANHYPLLSARAPVMHSAGVQSRAAGSSPPG